MRQKALFCDNDSAEDANATKANELQLTPVGQLWFAEFGIDAAALTRQHRSFCRACLDWSERRHYLAGSLGFALLQRMIELGWARRMPDSRVIEFTPQGAQAFEQWF